MRGLTDLESTIKELKQRTGEMTDRKNGEIREAEMIRGRTDVVGVRQRPSPGKGSGGLATSSHGVQSSAAGAGASGSRAILYLENRGNGVLCKETSFI